MARTITLRDGSRQYLVEVADDGTVRVDGGAAIAATPAGDGSVRVGRPARTAWVASSGGVRWVFLDGDVFRFEVETKGTRRRSAAHRGTLSAPMPATVVRIHAQPGAAVTRGDTLIILEAMKMELPVRAHADGILTQVRCREGELVQPGAMLIEMDESEP